MNFWMKLLKINVVLRPVSHRPLFSNGKFQKLPKRQYGNVLFACTTAGLSTIAFEESLNNVSGIVQPVDYKRVIKEYSTINASNFKQVIVVLQNAILETSEQYRQCLNRQMQLMGNIMGAKTLDAIWNDLIKYRTEAKQLKDELQLYENILNHVGQIAFGMDMCSTILQNSDEKCLYTHYTELVLLSQQQIAINKTFEDRLLEASVTHIFNTQVL